MLIFSLNMIFSLTFDENFCDLTVDKRELIREQKKRFSFCNLGKSKQMG